MKLTRRAVTAAMIALPFSHLPAWADDASPTAEAVLARWYKLMLELVRHTPTYTPPVASRTFAYVGITAFEVVASAGNGLQSLAGQVTGLTPPPACDPAQTYALPAIMQGAMTFVIERLFSNTGPTGQRALAAMNRKLGEAVSRGLDPATLARSMDHGSAVAAHIYEWSLTDGGAVIENMGFPYDYTHDATPAAWVPTSTVALQQAPLLPDWGKNRPFAMPADLPCGLPAPMEYSEDPASAFYANAKEVFDIKATLTDEQKLIARYWSDDAMLSTTPPGHWISIALQILDRDEADLATRVDVLARLGIAVADAFIACWATKYEYNLLRPVSYIRRVMGEAKWEPLINTPPFPEYPSGHSTQSAAAAVVLTALWGDDFAFDDDTQTADGLPMRSFASFAAAADEAAISRLYGGIHYREGVVRGQEQGLCVGAYAAGLKTRV
jgi:hypothetical protein